MKRIDNLKRRLESWKSELNEESFFKKETIKKIISDIDKEIKELTKDNQEE